MCPEKERRPKAARRESAVRGLWQDRAQGRELLASQHARGGQRDTIGDVSKHDGIKIGFEWKRYDFGDFEDNCRGRGGREDRR